MLQNQGLQSQQSLTEGTTWECLFALLLNCYTKYEDLISFIIYETLRVSSLRNFGFKFVSTRSSKTFNWKILDIKFMSLIELCVFLIAHTMFVSRQ